MNHREYEEVKRQIQKYEEIYDRYKNIMELTDCILAEEDIVITSPGHAHLALVPGTTAYENIMVSLLKDKARAESEMEEL